MPRPGRIAVADLVSDAVAAFALFAALAMPWDVTAKGAERWWVVLATVLAVLTLGLPHLGRSGVLPGWGAGEVRVLKRLLVAPYGVCILIALVSELLHINDLFEGGIGSGVAMGVAGAVLAVSPRSFDELVGRDEGPWFTLGRVLVGLGLVAVTASWVVWQVHEALNLIDANMFLATILSVVAQIGVVTAAVGAFLLPGLALMRGSAPWLRVLQTGVATVLIVDLVAPRDELFAGPVALQVEKLQLPLFGLFLLSAGAAALASRPVRRLLGMPGDAYDWVRTARCALVVSALGLLADAIDSTLLMIDAEDYAAERIVPIALTVLGIVASLVCLSLLLRTAEDARLFVLCTIAAIAIAGVIALTVENSSSSLDTNLNPYSIVFWLGLPGLAGFALLAPGSVRSTFKPMVSTQPPVPTGRPQV